MSFLSKRTYIILSLFILGLVVLPVTVFLFQQRQITQSQAEKTVILSFEPSSNQTSPMQIPAGSTFTLDVYVDPGANSVSFVKTEMLFDTTKFELAGGFIPNQSVFSQIVESAEVSPGKLVTTLSIGSDLSKALKAKTRVGTLTLKALSTVPANGTSQVTFGPGSQALSVSNNSSFDENVIASTVPATVTFNRPALTCGTSPTDVMMVIDRSGSMNDRVGTAGSKLAGAKVAASSFVDILSKETRNTTGLTTFESGATLNSSLTNNFSTVKSQVNAITTGGGTCIECGIVKANQDIAAKKRQGIKNVVVLLTDGRANFIVGNNREVSTSTAESRALAAAKSGNTANGTIFFTIGLGKDVNSDFLTDLAESTGGQYYFSPTTDQLNGIYKQISETLAKGAVSGLVFNDANRNGTIDQNEENISGWILQLYSSGTPQTITTDSTGSYSFNNLCDGTYTVRQVLKSGWSQTSPATPKDYTVTLTNGNAATGKNFGNNRGTRCADGIDNDGNGYADAKDSTCHKDGDPNNPGSYDPGIDGERGSNTCSDSKDNNGDGKIDGADPMCHPDGDPDLPWDPDLPEGAANPDLVVSNLQLSYDGPQNAPVCSTGVGVKVTIKNQGNRAVTAPYVVKVNDTIASVSGNLSVGATTSLWVKAPASTNSAETTALVDAGDQITELDESNNRKSVILPQPTPPIQCAPLTPTPTTTASGAANLNLNVLVHGIGNSGDNANPTASSLSNKNPLTKERNAVVSIFDVNNNLVATAAGKVVYSSESGSFKGVASTNTNIPSGKYSLKVRIDYHLTRLVGGIQTFVAGQTQNVPAVDMVAGDASNDNRLDIRDYNMLLDCYSDIEAAASCDAAKKLATDSTDDGNVNQFDYNLFLREISTQPGE
jgi:Mg-chelatase subunit ChlD